MDDSDPQFSSSVCDFSRVPRMPPVLTEVRVLHGLCCCQPLLVVVAQQLVQQVKGLRTHQVLVLRLDELLPALPRLSARTHTQTHTITRNPIG